METTPLIFLLAVLIIVLIVFVVMKIVAQAKEQKRRNAPPPPTPKDPFADSDSDVLRGDPRALKAGDIFDTHGETLTVRGSLRLKEGGYQWSEHLIDTGGGVKRWLSVEEDPDLELVLWTEIDDAPARPGAHHLQYRGQTFTLVDDGRARYVSEATTGLDRDGWVKYHDYEAPDGTKLAYEDFGETGSHEAALGLRIHRNEIVIYPQSP
jgi:hypothetical protein